MYRPHIPTLQQLLQRTFPLPLLLPLDLPDHAGLEAGHVDASQHADRGWEVWWRHLGDHEGDGGVAAGFVPDEAVGGRESVAEGDDFELRPVQPDALVLRLAEDEGLAVL